MHTTALRLVLLAACLGLLGACARPGGYRTLRPPPDLQADDGAAAPADDPRMYADLIRQMQARGLYYASLAHIDACERRYGDSPELRLLRADALRHTGHGAQAEPIYRSLLRGPQAGPAWHGLGLVAAASGRDAEAIGDFEHAIELDPINAAYLGDLGFARLRRGDLDGARSPLSKAAQLAPSDGHAISNMALLLRLEGQPARADALMRQAGLPADSRAAVRRMAQVLARGGARSGMPMPRGDGDGDDASHIPASLLERFQTPATPTPESSHEGS